MPSRYLRRANQQEEPWGGESLTLSWLFLEGPEIFIGCIFVSLYMFVYVIPCPAFVSVF